jgi:hypothetical protein
VTVLLTLADQQSGRRPMIVARVVAPVRDHQNNTWNPPTPCPRSLKRFEMHDTTVKWVRRKGLLFGIIADPLGAARFTTECAIALYEAVCQGPGGRTPGSRRTFAPWRRRRCLGRMVTGGLAVTVYSPAMTGNRQELPGSYRWFEKSIRLSHNEKQAITRTVRIEGLLIRRSWVRAPPAPLQKLFFKISF